MSAKRVILTLIFFLSCMHAAWAEPKLIATVDQENISINDATTLIITVSELDSANLQFPMDTPDYAVIAQSTSSSFRFINGVSSRSETYKFVIKPKHLGTITLPPATISAGSNVYSTEPILINVNNAPVSQPQANLNPGRVENRPPPVNNQRKKVFAVANISKSSPYNGEKVFLSLKIYHRGNLKALNIPFIDLKNFTYEKANKAKEYSEVYQGEEYFVYEVDYTLFPLRPGLVTIPSAEIKCMILDTMDSRDPRGDPFDPFRLFNPFLIEREISINSNPIQVNVKALPAAPKDFSGYVGALNLSHNLTAMKVKAGDAITLMTKINGTGNLKNLQNLDLVKESEQYSVFKDKASSSNIIKTAIIASKDSGKILVETKPVVFFNPGKGSYETIAATKFEVDVLVNPNKEKEEESVTDQDAEKVPVRKIQAPKIKQEILSLSEEEILNYQTYHYELILFALIALINIIALLVTLYRWYGSRGPQEKPKNLNQIQNQINKAQSVIEISQIIKNLAGKLSETKIQEFLTETDKVNYGFKVSEDPSKELEYFKTKALILIKEVINGSK